MSGPVTQRQPGQRPPGATSAGAEWRSYTTSIAWVLAILLTTAAAWMYWRAQGARELLPDEGIYSYVGWAWVSGDVIFRDAWEQKGPIVYVFPALRLLLLGNAPEWLGVQELVLGAACAFTVAATATMLWGGVIGAFVFLLDMMLWLQLPPNGGLVSTAGCVIALLGAASVFLLVRATLTSSSAQRTAALVAFGAFEGLLFWSRANAFVTLALAPVVILAVPHLRRSWAKHGLSIALGVVGSVAGVALWLRMKGALDAMLDIYFRFGPIRGQLAMEGLGPARVLRRMLTQYYRLALLPIAATVGAIAMIGVRARGRLLPAAMTDRQRLALVVVPGWFLLESLGYFTSSAYYHHALPSVPAVALAAGWALHSAAILNSRIPRRTATAVLCGLALLMVGRPLIRSARMRDGNPTPQPWRRVADVVARTTDPNDRILTISGFTGPAILTTSKRLSAVPWTFPMPLHARGYVTDVMWQRVADVLDGPHAVHTVIADLMGLPPVGPGDSTVAWTLPTIDHGLTAPMFQGDDTFPAKERVKALLVQHYTISHCDKKVCLLTRRSERETADDRGPSIGTSLRQ